MRITLDLATNEIIVPKNFFKNVDAINRTNEKMGAGKVEPLELIKRSFEAGFADTDRYLRTNVH